jgi:hypothetical protein
MSTTVNVSGGLLYIRQNASVVEFSTNASSWSTINFPMTINNTNTGAGVAQVLFTTDITLTSAISYFICGSGSIQFGSRTLKTDGSRPLITIDFSGNYSGIIRNGSSVATGMNNISVVNLRVVATVGVTLNNGGWIGQDYFGKGASSNNIVNCSSESPIASSCGGIAGSYVGNSSGNVTILG